jgi:hypothetical protein
MAATPSGHLTFLTTEFDRPFTPAGFGNWFRDQCPLYVRIQGKADISQGLPNNRRFMWQLGT